MTSTRMFSRVWMDLRAVVGMMQNTEERLRAIGFGGLYNDPVRWRVARVKRALSRRLVETAPDPACSRVLLQWRAVLATEPRSSPYRIRRV
jgi:hypothetical protein